MKGSGPTANNVDNHTSTGMHSRMKTFVTEEVLEKDSQGLSMEIWVPLINADS